VAASRGEDAGKRRSEQSSSMAGVVVVSFTDQKMSTTVNREEFMAGPIMD
jgi:hypothetical protein